MVVYQIWERFIRGNTSTATMRQSSTDNLDSYLTRKRGDTGRDRVSGDLDSVGTMPSFRSFGISHEPDYSDQEPCVAIKPTYWPAAYYWPSPDLDCPQAPYIRSTCPELSDNKIWRHPCPALSSRTAFWPLLSRADRLNEPHNDQTWKPWLETPICSKDPPSNRDRIDSRLNDQPTEGERFKAQLDNLPREANRIPSWLDGLPMEGEPYAVMKFRLDKKRPYNALKYWFDELCYRAYDVAELPLPDPGCLISYGRSRRLKFHRGLAERSDLNGIWEVLASGRFPFRTPAEATTYSEKGYTACM